MKTRKESSGFTLVEVLGAIVVSSFLMAGLISLWHQFYGGLQQAQAARHLQSVADASHRFIKQHYEELLDQASPAAGPQITIDQLIADSYLPEGFQPTNVWEQEYAIYVRRPQENSLMFVVVTTGGRDHDDDDPFANVTVPGAAMRVKSGGGFVPTGDVDGLSDDVLVGAGGGYVLELANLGIASPGAGHLGLYSVFDDYDLGTDYLYRESVPGHPEYNEMSVELDMTGHGIERVGSVQFVSRVVNAGDGCAAEDEGLFFLDETQGMYLCRNNSLVLMADSGNSAAVKSATIATNGQRITKPSCGNGTGKTPQIYVAPVDFSSGASSPSLAAVQAWATSVSDTQWQVHLRVMNTKDSTWVNPPANYGHAMVFAICN